MPRIPRKYIARLNRAKGRRFELEVRQKFLAEGFLCERVDETDFGAGCDLRLFMHRDRGPSVAPEKLLLPVAIQVKCTQTAADLLKGLEQAQRGWPAAKLHVCVQNYRPAGRRAGRIRCAASFSRSASSVYTDLEFSAIITLIRQLLVNNHGYDTYQAAPRQSTSASPGQP